MEPRPWMQGRSKSKSARRCSVECLPVQLAPTGGLYWVSGIEMHDNDQHLGIKDSDLIASYFNGMLLYPRPRFNTDGSGEPAHKMSRIGTLWAGGTSDP